MSIMRRIFALMAVAAILVVGVVSVAGAQTGGDSTATEADVPPGLDFEGDLFGDLEDWEPSAEELAEINADTDALVEYLQDLGFEVTVATDELGFRYVDFDESTDEAIFEAMDDFYQAQFADEVAGWSDAEKAEWNAGTDAFVAELAAGGITVETEEIALGVYDIVWTDELDEALMDFEGDLCDEHEEGMEGEFAESA